MKSPRAILFDLDGTLLDTRLDIAAACNHALAAVDAPLQSVEEIRGFVGDGARSLVLQSLGPSRESLLSAALAEFNQYYAEHPADHAAWLPGAHDAMDACRALRMRLALVTNKPRPVTLALLRTLGVLDSFGVVVAGGDGPLKPDPAPVERALKALEVAPEDAWIVGDGTQDIVSGKGAGVTTLAVLGGYGEERRLRDANPDWTLGSLSELRPLLARLSEAEVTERWQR